MSTSRRNGLLPGISAYDWWIITVVVFVCFFAEIAAIVGLSAPGFAGNDVVSVSRQPALWYSLFAVSMLTVLMIGVTGYGLPISMRRELRAGYSTLASATLSVDIRDPRDGRVLLPAGVGPRRRVIRLGPLRRAAVAAADRPVVPAADEPPPLRLLDISGGAHGIPWNRKRLETFESAVAAAVPDALLIGALREPLAEQIAARYRPGVRIHFTYLIAVRPTGLQLWQDPHRPALILEIPRDSIIDVLPKVIQNDQAVILGITIVITDPAGIVTELPFLPQRPQHPLLFVKSDDIEPLMSSMRRIWGMPVPDEAIGA